MAKVVITIEDVEDENEPVAIHFDMPNMDNEEKSLALGLAILIYQMIEESQSDESEANDE